MIDLLTRAVARDDQAIADLNAVEPNRVVDAAEQHGMLALLNDALGRRLGADEPLVAALLARTRHEMIADLLMEAELPEALTALTTAGAEPVVMKGTHLAYAIYPRPELRPRVDTDILIAPDRRRAVDRALSAIGYRRQDAVSGDLVSYQSLYVKRAGPTPVSALDVHWKIANAQMFSGVLSHCEARADSIPMPRLGPDARGLSNVHALLLACLHRIAHHRDCDRLIWLYDIRLIAERLAADEWASFVALAVERQMVGVCQRSLDRADRAFPPVRVRPSAITGQWANPEPEPTAGYLAPRRNLHAIADDLRALPRWSDRWQLLREHLFPPAQYMRTVYAPASRVPLALLHVRRLVFGAHTWLGRRKN